MNAAEPQPKGTPPSKLDSHLVIEKIIILGLDTERSHYTATAGSTSFPTRGGVGVDPRMGKGKGLLVRTVKLPVNSDWTLKIGAGKAAVATE